MKNKNMNEFYFLQLEDMLGDKIVEPSDKVKDEN